VIALKPRFSYEPINDNTGKITEEEQTSSSQTLSDEIVKLKSCLQEVSAKLEFIAMLSHDIRSPLTSLRELLEFIGSGRYGTITDEGLRLISLSQNNIDRLFDLATHVLDFDRIDSIGFETKLSPVPISDLIYPTVELVQQIAEKSDIRLNIQGASKTKVLCDRNLMIQVFFNLVANAVKFSPAGSEVAVRFSEHDGKVMVEVRDRGPGIPHTAQSKIFEKWQQAGLHTSAERQGYGLGLANCKAIIARHNGQIGVHNRKGGGSTFWVRLASVEETLESTKVEFINVFAGPLLQAIS
jgi:signal transduction histidine kinase